MHHCLAALKEVLNFKVQLNATFRRTASYFMFLKMRQEEGLLCQIRFKRVHLEAAWMARWEKGLVANPGDSPKSSDTY